MLSLAFAQTASAAGADQTAANPVMGLMPIVLIFVVFYFLLIKPQKKQQKEHAGMLEQLKKNDDVVTSGGIYGTIVNIQDDIITLRVDDNTRIKIQKNAIARLKK
ncbi:MAG: preprotein translocase subunit YajC [Candidatus Omnitrophota bacterium]|nr:preprotein translocase subunit YajC [Candidatus Omnitrophota bacterium]